MCNINKRNYPWVAFLFMLVSALFPFADPAEAVDWTIYTIDKGGDNSMAVDSNNHVHISYAYSDETNTYIKYATNASGYWVTSTIDTGTVAAGDDLGFTSIAVDSNNHAHISYYRGTGTNHDVMYATNASGNWVASTIDSIGNLVWPITSMAVDSKNHVHICYYDESLSALKYATNASGNWVVSTIDTAAYVSLYGASIAVDSNNNVHIGYPDITNKALKYAANASGDWVTSTIDTGDLEFASIAVDSNNNVHIGYSDITNKALKYATNTSGDWVTSTIDSTDEGFYDSIAIDSNNNVHISYYSRTFNRTNQTINDAVKYATNASGDWITSIIDNLGDLILPRTSIAVDANNDVYIIYLDSSNTIKYAGTSTACPLLLAPTLTSPADGATGISTTPPLGWGIVPGATTYGVQICGDSACNDVVTSTSAPTISQWTAYPLLNNDTQYWWRAKADNSCGNSSQWSGTSSFTTNTRSWAPKISVPVSVDLGPVRVGDTNAKTVTVKNTGNEDLLIYSITITGANQSEFIQTSYQPSDCSTVAAKSECPVYVTFVPVAPFGKKRGILSISSNDPKKPTVDIKLMGQAPPPKISVSPRSVSFASVQVGNTSLVKTITVKNTGMSDLVIGNIAITGANADGFSQTNSCGTIPKAGSCAVNVTFAPEQPGAGNSATLSIPSNDPKNAITNVNLSGVGK
jgi:hypothetical protein